jgi:uncharacterized membrane protein YphA (DoxX/SURF4 family)
MTNPNEGLGSPHGAHALALLRIVTALLFIAHGIQKYFGFPVPGPLGLAAPFSLMGAAGIPGLARALNVDSFSSVELGKSEGGVWFMS